MQKIPTMFVRDWEGDRSHVLDKPHPNCAWVFGGEGRATIKLDGTCVLVKGGERYKRREIKQGQRTPDGFDLVGTDEETGKSVGWLPVSNSPDDQWLREAVGGEEDGTYELVGPKIQGNPEGFGQHELVRHGCLVPDEDPPRTFAGLRAWLAGRDIEGLVFHHSDGRMAKIKLRDFGLKRGGTGKVS